MNIVITGVSRGIGLELTKDALNKGHKVFGVARTETQELVDLKQKFPALTIISLDLCEGSAAEKLRVSLKDCQEIDVLINNAGIYETGTTKAEFLHSFEVNSYLPFMVTDVLLDKLKKTKHPKLIHISSLMGSIADNTSGDSYAYRASKCALNMINKCLSVDHNWLTCIVMHPGWVQTRMGGENAPTNTLDSSAGIWRVVEELTLKDTGKFYSFQGKELPW